MHETGGQRSSRIRERCPPILDGEGLLLCGRQEKVVVRRA